jgi:ABC-type Fe3+-hydroxamate transport system substrate-binding protein
MATRHGTSALVAVLLALSLGACASMGSPSISEVQANAGRYTDHTVTVTGTVTSAWGIPLVPYKMYRVSDGSAEILVLSDGDRTPTRGARVRVRGEVEDVAVIGGRSVGLHLREKSLKVL